jgi:D-arginine dehydrogenase
VIGRDPAVPGFVWLAGQGSFGIMTVPAMARLAAGLTVDDRLPADVGPARRCAG